MGTLVQVESVVTMNPISGESNLRLRGLKRFRVVDVPRRFSPLRMENDKFGLFSADVKCFEDEDDTTAAPQEPGPEAESLHDLMQEARSYCNALKGYDETLQGSLETMNAEQLSYLMCFLCSLSSPIAERQKWLECTNSYSRLSEALFYYRNIVK